MKHILSTALFGFLLSGQAIAAEWEIPTLSGAFETGETLNEACQSSDLELNAFCFGYLIGVADSLAGKAIRATDPEFCMTEAVNQGKVEGVGKWWLANNQQRGHIAADSLVVEALILLRLKDHSQQYLGKLHCSP